jgi:hypothetical protein
LKEGNRGEGEENNEEEIRGKKRCRLKGSRKKYE